MMVSEFMNGSRFYIMKKIKFFKVRWRRGKLKISKLIYIIEFYKGLGLEVSGIFEKGSIEWD